MKRKGMERVVWVFATLLFVGASSAWSAQIAVKSPSSSGANGASGNVSSPSKPLGATPPSSGVKQKKLPAGANRWRIDQAHSKVEFEVGHLGELFPVSGRFREIQLREVRYNRSDITKSSIHVVIPMQGLTTDHAKRDKHLLGRDFFDAEHHPTIRFRSASITKIPKKGTLKVCGKLTIRGTSKKQCFTGPWQEVAYPNGKRGIAFAAKGSLKRLDFKVGSGFMAKVIDKKVSFRLVLKLIENLDSEAAGAVKRGDARGKNKNTDG